jgi:hypothetical protein
MLLIAWEDFLFPYLSGVSLNWSLSKTGTMKSPALIQAYKRGSPIWRVCGLDMWQGASVPGNTDCALKPFLPKFMDEQEIQIYYYYKNRRMEIQQYN